MPIIYEESWCSPQYPHGNWPRHKWDIEGQVLKYGRDDDSRSYGRWVKYTDRMSRKGERSLSYEEWKAS